MGQVLRGVELFASGEYRGRTYTPGDIDQCVTNGRKFADVLHPPAVKGHEEEDRDGNPTAAPEEGRTDLPADGWINPASLTARWKTTPVKDGGKVRVIRQKVLVGDIENVPDEMAEAIRQKRYRKVSAEIYDDFTDGSGVGHGKALRRVAFLGGEPPQVKEIADLPMPAKFAERLRPSGGRATGAGTYVAFAEVVPVTRDENLQAIQAAMPGVQPATLTGLEDDQLADLAKNLPPTAPAPAAQLTQPPTPAVETAPMVDRAALIQALVGAGQPQAQLDAMTDEQLVALAAQLGIAPPAPAAAVPAQPAVPMADGDPAAAPAEGEMTPEEMKELLVELGADPATLEGKTPEELQAMLDELMAADAAATEPPPAQPAAPMSDKAKKFSERVIAESKAQLAQLRIARAAMKRERVTTFCERLVQKGVILPAQKADYVSMLMNTPDVAKFSDTGAKLTVSALDKKMADLSRRQPIVRFGERVPSGGGNPTRTTGEVRKVEKFTELYGPELRKAGTDPKSLIERAKARAAENPDFEAAEIIGRNGVAMVS